MIYLFKIGFLEINWVDIIDIFLVAFLLFQVYKLIKGSVAFRVFLGFLSLYLIFLLVNAAEMNLLSTILGEFMGVGITALLIVFQPEIRKFLLMVGKSTSFNRENFLRFPWKRSFENANLNLTPIVEAAKVLGGSNTGALIAFARSSELKFYAESGDPIDALVSKRLLLSIFNKNSPMHDGAVIIAKGRIKAARCILPVSENDAIPANYGLRHRAAIGLTEVTDGIVLIVSEETGQISLSKNGVLHSNLSFQELRTKLSAFLTDQEERESQVKKETRSKQVGEEI